jgi:(S)-ureidoglycine aminohydrolase
MKNGCVVLLLLCCFAGSAQTQRVQTLPAIPSIKYSWRTPGQVVQENVLSTVMFQGSGHDMEYLRMEASSLLPSPKKALFQVPDNEEHLFLMKSGTMTISFGDSTWSIGPGSIVLLMPAERYSVQNTGRSQCLFYVMKYRSRTPVNPERGTAAGGSFVKDWNKIPFVAHARGGVRRYFQKPTAMCKRFEMHVTTLNAGLKSHDAHTHRAEEIILLLEDTNESKSKTEMQIGENFLQGEAGEIYYVGSNILHGIRNTGNGQCSYFAFQFE